MISSNRLTIAGVCERGLDLLLLEEFSSSLAFSRWFVSHTTSWPGKVGAIVSVHRSVTQSTGESDLELTVQLDSGPVARLLIENKIDAGFQVDQAIRYRKRAETYLNRGECALCTTVLVAPSRYLGKDMGDKGFDARISYEEPLEWLGEGDLGARLAYKAALLSAAIEKSTLGYQPVADAPVTNFWREYWQATLALAPELEMAEPSSKPARAGFAYFRPAILPRGIDICHKFPHGNVDLQFRGWGNRLAELRAIVAPHLVEGMRVVKAAKSASIRLRTRTLNTGLPFAAQEPEAVAGIRAARTLLNWYVQHSTSLAPLARLAGP